MKSAILIVDDEASVREYLSSILADNYDVTTAATGAEALDLIRDEVFYFGKMRGYLMGRGTL